jgi:uncharacterized protein (TIGR03086 family)
VREGLVDRFVRSSADFEWRLREVRPDQWAAPTPCTDWNVRQLVNHMTQANLSYVRLVHGGTREEFLRHRDADALGSDPVAAYTRSVRECADAFAEPVPHQLDHPLGAMAADQALAMRTTDSTIHTWDLARAIGADEHLDAGLVEWIDEHLHEIYAGLPETPIATTTTHRFFAAPAGGPAIGGPRQDRLLHLMGRNPQRGR